MFLFHQCVFILFVCLFAVREGISFMFTYVEVPLGIIQMKCIYLKIKLKSKCNPPSVAVVSIEVRAGIGETPPNGGHIRLSSQCSVCLLCTATNPCFSGEGKYSL